MKFELLNRVKPLLFTLAAVNLLMVDLNIFSQGKKLLAFDGNNWDVVGVVDGNTLNLAKGSRQLKVKLCGVDAPKTTLGVESKDYLKSLVARGQSVYLTRVGKDSSGNTIGELSMPLKSNPEQELSLNGEMLKAGMGWLSYENCPNQEGLDWNQAIAIEDRVGVWSLKREN